MAFNLNKNEGAGPSSKFDLSKSNPPAMAVTEPEKRKANAWPFVIAGLLVAGLAAWYFMPASGPDTENTVAATSDSTAPTISSGDQTAATQTTADTVAAMKAENTGTSATTGKIVTAAQTGNDNNAAATAAVTAGSLNNRTPATFAKGSNAISNLDKSLVKDIIAVLQKDAGAVISVNGYASSEGDGAVNQKISQARADAFKSYLVSKGIAPGNIIATGKGIDNPVSPNDTEEGRIKNRRVEIVFQ